VVKEAGIQIPFVGPDNRRGARLVGEHLAQRLQPGDEVAILEGLRTSFNGQQRKIGFEEAMQAAGIQELEVYTLARIFHAEGWVVWRTRPTTRGRRFG